MARLDQPDDLRYPHLKIALAAAPVAELHPGDAIYMPPLWWHNVESLEIFNALVNYWWSPIEVEGYNTGHTRTALYHGLLAFRALPPAGRANWRILLDYYVFGSEEAVAHIPEDRRRVLGPLTAETAEQLKQGRASVSDEQVTFPPVPVAARLPARQAADRWSVWLRTRPN